MSENNSPTTALWTPSQAQIEATELFRFAQQAQNLPSNALPSTDYAALWQWSIDQKELFWDQVWDFCGVIGDKGARVFQDAEHLMQTRWFPEAQLNYAENLLAYSQAQAQPNTATARDTEKNALVFWGEDKVKQNITHQQLVAAVHRCQIALQSAGVTRGDRVAAYLPNSPYAIIAMLACTSLGAVWSSASPDFGVEGVVDRFGQIGAKVLFCTEGYYYNGKWQDCHAKNVQIIEHLASVENVVICPYMDTAHEFDVANDAAVTQPYSESRANVVDWRRFLATKPDNDVLEFERVGFSDPLFILFSSGTTGVPKCIVHGVGGTLLQHLKEHQLHSDVRPGDKLFYFSTCGWMMWNWLASGLASGATLALYDGSPFAGNQTLLFDMAEQLQMTHFGTSAKFIEACHKSDLNLAKTHKLDALRAIFSTGSPLAPAGFEYVYERIKDNVVLSSISGGTDILSCFALGNPTLPVYIGQLQCVGLGMAVKVYDDEGYAMPSGKGDLVCTESFPSMPIGFWQDESGEKYFDAYFNQFENVWCHGDYVELTEQGGMIIHGRSDAVLNPGGVRIGTAEIYRQVETIPEVLESIVIGQRWQDDVRVILFVVLRADMQLDDELINTIKQTIRAKTTPRHVPAKVIQVADIPRTKSGKIVELAVRNIVHAETVKNLNSLANPQALDLFKNLVELQS